MLRNVIFISADYRLLLPATSHDEIDDVKALFHFLSTDISKDLPTGISLDSSRLAVAGTSAGGYIGRLAALYAEPRPRALLSLYGMGGDFLHDHWLKDGKPTPLSVSGKAVMIERQEVAHLLDAKEPEWVSEAQLALNPNGMLGDPLQREKLMNWWWQTGEYLDHVTGEVGISKRLRSISHDQRDSEANIPAASRAANVLPQLHINSNFPPTMFVHGDADTIVLVEESTHTYNQLQAAGVHSELHVIPKAEHGLKSIENQKTPPEAEALQPKMFEFLMDRIA